MGECISAHRDLHDNPLLGSTVPNHGYIAPDRKISAAATKLRPLLQIARKPPAGRGPTGRGVPGTAQSRARRVGRGGRHLGRPGGGGRPAGGRPAAVGSRTLRARYSARLLIQFQPFSVS